MILVPVKNLGNAKQRLSPMLNPQERALLAQAMLQDVMDALAACSHRNEVALVTGDAQARGWAWQYGFHVIDDGVNPGETQAVEMATDACMRRGAQYTLVVPGDIPLIRASELESIFAASNGAGTILVPSASGRGTNAVCRRPANLFPLRFGNDSFLPHLAAARATEKPVEILRLPGIGLDVDEPADLAELLASPGVTRAQRLLGEWKVGERLQSAAHG